MTSQGVQPASIRRQNVSAVLRTVLTHGPMPRVEIARLSSLSGGSVTRITGELMRQGIIRQLPGASGGRQGAPRRPLDLCAEKFLALGVHVGQRRTNVGLVDLRGRSVDKAEIQHDDTEPRRMVQQAAEIARHVLDRRNDAAITLIGTGLSVGGWVNPASMVVENHGLGWRNVSLRDLAVGQFPAPLSVDSTYRSLARAHLVLGITPQSRSFLLLFLGNLIGAAIVVDGTIQEGTYAAAGRVAHLPVSMRGEPCAECGRRNCFLTVAGDQAVLNRAVTRGFLSDDASDHQLMEFVNNIDDASTRRILHPRAQAVGEVVAMLTDILDPDHVMLSDPMVAAPDYMRLLYKAAANNRHANDAPQRLVPVSTDPVVSAAVGALDNFYNNPVAPRPTESPRRSWRL